ncbi:hypothetical protein P3G55_15340 [Leptospira sp. 96542]|nr:hypothetical protein [Leptospira sp. 96542]
MSERAKCEDYNKRNDQMSANNCLAALMIFENSEDKGTDQWERSRANYINQCLVSYIRSEKCHKKSNTRPSF